MTNKLQRRNILAVVVPAVVVLLTAVAVVAMQSKSSVQAPAPANGTIEVKGTALCLPHKDTSGPQTLECALGIKDENGQHYALSDTDPEYKNVGNLSMNEPVIITGTFEKGESKIYPTIGTIKVTKVTR